jgi:hypothetical protein
MAKEKKTRWRITIPSGGDGTYALTTEAARMTVRENGVLEFFDYTDDGSLERITQAVFLKWNHVENLGFIEDGVEEPVPAPPESKPIGILDRIRAKKAGKQKTVTDYGPNAGTRFVERDG